MQAGRGASRAVLLAAVTSMGFFMAPRAAWGQADEIQVYDGGLATPGVFNLTWHNNYTPKGVVTPAFPNAVVADKSLNGVPEWAYGVTEWFEAGLYLPLYSIARTRSGRTAMIDGGKVRLLFAVPHADDRKFFYGVNFEFSYNGRRWDSRRITSEIRPIIGWHLHSVDLIVNPIFDTSYDGLENLDFVPATRVAWKVSKASAIALEEYADFGPVHDFYPRSQQAHQLYGVFDHSTKLVDIEAGIGIGLSDATDRVTLKLILSRDLNSR